jgi:hypothetical protein
VDASRRSEVLSPPCSRASATSWASTSSSTPDASQGAQKHHLWFAPGAARLLYFLTLGLPGIPACSSRG